MFFVAAALLLDMRKRVLYRISFTEVQLSMFILTEIKIEQ